MSGSNGTDCLFCAIVAGQVPADVVYQNDDVVAFRDINPVAPVHVLVVTRRHVTGLSDMSVDDLELGRLMASGAAVAAREGLTEGGYRAVINTGRDAAQSVRHIHLHILGGRSMAWPPG